MATKKFGRIMALLLSALLLCAPACPAVSAAAEAEEDICPQHAGGHEGGSWQHDGTYHWKGCIYCGAELQRGYHSDDLICKLCGYMQPNNCDHVWAIDKRTSAFTHQEKCTICGMTRSVDCTTSTFITERGSCLLPWRCACGNTYAEEFPEHNWSVWETTGDTHTRHCTNPGCTVVETGNHEYLPTINCTDPVSCSICGMENGPALHTEHNWSSWINTGSGTHYRYCMNGGCSARESEAHNPAPNDDRTIATVCEDCGAVIEEALSGHHWGAWTANAAGGHSRSCLDEGCSAKQGALHTGGTATCNSPAQCADCGAYYGSKDPNKHSGGTEIRDAKPAAEGVAGYTGDTVCLGCGAVIKEGEEIPALEKAHTHSYGSDYQYDSVRHWKECACGEKSESAEHTFKDGVCTVCHAPDPSYRAPKADHKHTFKTNNQWEHNADKHWRVCKDCGAIVDTAAHEYTYSISYNETGHWFNCVCGESKFGEHNYDPETHICADCKMMDPEFAPEYPEWPEEPDPSTSPDPETSTDPETSKTPAPSESTDPETSKTPDPSESKDPETSKTPAPSESTGPETSKTPAPSESTDPETSKTPEPGESKGPETSKTPDPSESKDPEESKTPDPSESKDPEESKDPDPDASTEPTDPKPGESTEPTDPEPSDPGKTDPTEPDPTDPTEPDPDEPYYVDLDTNVVYFESVQKATSYGLMSGVGNGKFNPDGTFTRGQLAALMYNMADKPETEAASSFSDVEQGQWYSDAVNWASDIGLVAGSGDGTFKPADNTDRETVAVILYNYAGIMGLSQEYDAEALDAFDDADQVQSWAKDAMLWAVTNGIFVPNADGKLNPKENATRAEVAMFSVAFVDSTSAE